MEHRKHTLAVLLSCACLGACFDASELDAPVAEQRHKQIMLNQMHLEPLLINAIASDTHLAFLGNNALSTGTLDSADAVGELGWQLIDDNARVFMDYLVRCALAPEDPPVKWTNPMDANVSETWTGQLGLCSDWADGAPTSECLELVSACMLAAENALEKSVATSQRGLHLNGSARSMDAVVTVKVLDGDGAPIDSFGACPGQTHDADRDCGWSAGDSFVGVCGPGKSVTLHCDQGSSPGVVRICEGHTGCDHGSTERLAFESDMCGASDEITFTCPDGGSYAVMAGGDSSDDPVAFNLYASTGSLPASEPEVFDRREGAYFGNMLIPGSRSGRVSSYVDSTGVVHRDVPPGSALIVNLSMYACHDIDWSDLDAYATHRLCAVVKDDEGDMATLCAAHSVGVCHDPAVLPPARICANNDTSAVIGDGDFGDCSAGGDTWDHSVTVFLDHPCDLASPDLEADNACPGLVPWQP